MTVAAMDQSNHRLWRIFWSVIPSTTRRYQEPVTRERVLREHRGAIGAEPIRGARTEGRS